MASPTIKYVGIYTAFAATAIALTATLGLDSGSQQATSMNDTTSAPTTTPTRAGRAVAVGVAELPGPGRWHR